MKIQESIVSNLSDKISSEVNKLGLPTTLDNAVATNDLKRAVSSEVKENKKTLIKKSVKKGVTDNLVSTTKLKKPIAKISSVSGGKEETKEVTGCGSSGSVEGLFSTTEEQTSKPKKVETKEATGSSSAGSYETNSIWAKSMSKKNWRGLSKPLIPGGKFVEVKDKCKKFPYCNQGDIKALKIFENEVVKKVITNVSLKYGVTEEVVRNILSYEYNKSKTIK